MSVLEKNVSTSIRVTSLAQSIQQKLNQSISSISAVNGDLRLLAFNAKIQAAKAGDMGTGFGVVANEIKDLVATTQDITSDLQSRVGHTIEELMHLNEMLETQVRGRRLAQVAENCIDLVDRNLYERSCDVRWWATECSVVQALTDGGAQALRLASERLATILESYTVYYDLVLCDREGRVVCNGRPELYGSVGSAVGDAEWFCAACNSISGTQFGCAGPFSSSLVQGKKALLYSCGVRAEGKPEGALLGVLGIVFNWEGLGRTVVERAQAMLDSESAHNVRAYLCTPDGRVIASSLADECGREVPVPDLAKLYNSPERFCVQQEAGAFHKLMAYAPSLGYETYKTGWVAVVVENRC